MAATEFSLQAKDGAKLFVRRWLPDGAPRAIVQIAHGLAEHSERYRDFAAALNEAGFGVYANDHRGHGPTARPEDLGFFAADNGWRRCLDDLWSLNRHIAEQHPGAPIVMFAHSMGSFMAQAFIAEHGEALAGVALSGSNGRPPAIAALGRLIARFERLRLGARGRSELLNKMWFGAFNKPFAPARTRFDWLSRNPAAVDAYIADPLCGFNATTQLAIDLLDVLPSLLTPAALARVPRSLPIYIMSGERDPVGANLKSLIDAYRGAGLNPTVRLYPDARHELLNETNREAVKADFLGWIEGVVGKAPTNAAA
ncbi:MAG: alpha/beta hydrolase [Hyphomicrobiales bacterium]|nr:alpha/beta hydrolase [Hyphomicrobiales bacterium]MBV8663731.1 alpha/beta hydrolase [Hyphomicrobiales bacterium]